MGEAVAEEHHKVTRLTPMHRKLVQLLAQVAVDAYLSESVLRDGEQSAGRVRARGTRRKEEEPHGRRRTRSAR